MFHIVIGKDMIDYASLLSERLSKLWTGWEIRIMILLSLLLQIILIHFGSQRKHSRSFWMRMLVWSAYMVADSVAFFALGNIAKINVTSGCHSARAADSLQLFWAPFLLLHLGGPDTITAYSLEDNELWKRHLLQLSFQVIVAAYAIVWTWSNSILKFLAIPIFIGGTLKYAERTYVLWSASTDRFKEVLLSDNSFKDDAERIVMGITEEGFFESNIKRGFLESNTKIAESRKKQQDEGDHSIDDAYYLFQRFRYIFAGLTLGVNERNDCYDVTHQKPAVEAFKLVAIELGFMYDVLYTKANIIYSRRGIILRIIFFVTSIFALLVFHLFIGLHTLDDATDSSITYVLLCGAIGLEVYAFMALVLSDWTQLWLFKFKLQKPWMYRIRSYISSFSSWFNKNKRWSICMAQFSLLSYCLDDVQGTWFGLHKMPFVKDWIKEYPYLTWKKVSADLQEAILKELQRKCDRNRDDQTVKSCKALLARRGDHAVEEWRKREGITSISDEFSWSTVDMEFDHSILVWHIATDICYYVDFEGGYNTERNLLEKRKVSKCLSDYMLYLLVLFPSMLPEGIGEIRFRDTCDQLKKILKNENEKQKIELCNKLIRKISESPSDQSVLYDGCKLAKQLQSSQIDRTKKWTMISEVWIEMLTYAANRCRWKEHAQQLWKGGELLTHVCLLMTNLGLSEYYTEEERFLYL